MDLYYSLFSSFLLLAHGSSLVDKLNDDKDFSFGGVQAKNVNTVY